jgi:hypothetical protein
MSTETWLKVTRPDDGETVGYLEPLAEDYSLVQPRSLLGHGVGEPAEFLAGEERLQERGIAELAERWHLAGAEPELSGGVVILEVSTDGIVVAHAEMTKALLYSKRVTVPWPDLDQSLRRRQ